MKAANALVRLVVPLCVCSLYVCAARHTDMIRTDEINEGHG